MIMTLLPTWDGECWKNNDQPLTESSAQDKKTKDVCFDTQLYLGTLEHEFCWWRTEAGGGVVADFWN
jgi:hypothetical protein